jgi:hypothetical protein
MTLGFLPAAARFAVGTLAVWRIVHLLVAEDGPWDSVFRLRVALGNSFVGKAMDCFYCTSIWAAAPMALLLVRPWPDRAVLWLALSGAASLLEQATSTDVVKEQK